jgi:dUTP pyrophosphatase
MMLEYKRLRHNVRPPERANPSDAGLDVFFCPADPLTSVARIPPGGGAVLQTGLKFGVPHGYMLEVKNRSSVAAKRSLLIGACVIDSGYNGEIFINLNNVGTETQFVAPGDKIAQLVLVPVVHFRAIETSEGLYDWYPITISDRDEGALGSTDDNE